MSTDESIELDEVDFEEPPPTDPCPGAIPRQSLRVDSAEDDLEKRLAWLAEEVRTASAEQAQIRRDNTVLERREYKNASILADAKQPQDLNADLPKVTLAVGVDPKRDPTLVGRRISEHQWDFDVSDPDDLARTLPLDAQSAIADPLPFHSPPDKLAAHRAASSRGLIGLSLMLLGGLLQYFIHSSSRAAFADIPMAQRKLGQAAMLADARYNSARDAETTRLIIPQIIQSTSANQDPSGSIMAPSASFPSAAPTFRYVKPPAPFPRKTSSTNPPTPTPSSVLHAPILRDTNGF
jgi:hypothetical protein